MFIRQFPFIARYDYLHTADKVYRDMLYGLLQGDSLVVNSTNIPAYGGTLKHCEYVEIIRPKEGDSSFDLGHKHYEFQNRITIKKEFIKVKLQSKQKSRSNFFYKKYLCLWQK